VRPPDTSSHNAGFFLPDSISEADSETSIGPALAAEEKRGAERTLEACNFRDRGQKAGSTEAMLYVDIPTQSEFKALAERRADACVSIYIPTTPITQNIDASRIALRNLSREASLQLEEGSLDKRRIKTFEQQMEELAADTEFWKYQSSSLAVFATPEDVRTYRLPNDLSARVDVSDRFQLSALVRTLSFPYAAFVLAISQGSVRLIEITENAVCGEVSVPDLPNSLSEATGRSMPRDRAPTGRLQGSEGQKTLIRQFSREVDRALRSHLAGQTQPLILAGVDYVVAIYRSMNSYPYLLDEALTGNFDQASATELAAAAREILTRAYQKHTAVLQDRFSRLKVQNRTSSDLVEIAQAATLGAVDTVLIDIDIAVEGTVNESGGVELSGSPSVHTYDVVSETAVRVLLCGGSVVGLRRADIPEGRAMGALLRYSFSASQ
jgi:hypothetical protein